MIRNAIYLIAGFLLATAGVVFASEHDPNGTIEGQWPDGVEVWRVDGKIFQRVDVGNGEFDVYYWCEGECDGATCPIDPNFTPSVTETPITPPETSTPEFSPTPTDEPPEERGACNRGIGNLEENCDPGNSFGQGQGEGRPAGEDRDEAEGAPPPRRGDGKPDR